MKFFKSQTLTEEYNNSLIQRLFKDFEINAFNEDFFTISYKEKEIDVCVDFDIVSNILFNMKVYIGEFSCVLDCEEHVDFIASVMTQILDVEIIRILEKEQKYRSFDPAKEARILKMFADYEINGF